MFKGLSLWKAFWAGAVACLLAAVFQIINTSAQGVLWESPNAKSLRIEAEAKVKEAEAKTREAEAKG
jgi:hypothetical protein